MRHIPATGERVVCGRYLGVGVVEGVKILRHMARVRWSGRLVAWVPIEDLETPPAASGTSQEAPQGAIR